MNAVLLLVTMTGVLFALAIYFAVADFVARRKAGKGKPAPSKVLAASWGFDANANLKLASESFAVSKKNRTGWLSRLGLWIEQSGTRLKPIELISASCILGFVSAGSVVLLLSNGWLALLACLMTSPLPFAVIAIERYRRSDKIRSQLPDALDLMSRMLRAGQTISQSLSGVADEFASPIADEFGYCYEQQNLGLSTEDSMYEMARRTGVLEIRILVVALTIHRQSGGNLSELLDNLAKVIRERYRIQGQIRALTADGRLQAAILLALPPLLLVVLSIVNQEYVTILYQFPWLLIGMFGFELFGALWLHRIVSFDF